MSKPATQAEWPPIIKKADRMFRIPTLSHPSLSGNKQVLKLDHATGRDREQSLETAWVALGCRDEYYEEEKAIKSYYKDKLKDNEKFEEEREKCRLRHMGKARTTLDGLIDRLEPYYEHQGIVPCATWLPIYTQEESGRWKKAGSIFYIQSFIHIASRELAYGEPEDYAKYMWAIKKSTQSAHDKCDAITEDMGLFLKSGKGGKEVSHFLSACLKSDIHSVPLLGFNKTAEK